MDMIKDAIRTRLEEHASGTRRLSNATSRRIGTAIIWVSLGILIALAFMAMGG